MSELCLDVVMDDLDRDNLLVLTTFAGSVVAVIVGYLLAWRAKRTGTAPPDGTYKTALQFRNLMLLVAHWSAPNSELLMAAGIHIPLWPLRQVNLAHHEQLPQLNMSEPMAPLDRFCSSLGVCDADFFQM